MALRTSADSAEDVAAGFHRFRDPLPEHETEITLLIADLYTISSSLKKLEDLSKDRRYRRTLPAARPDLELVRTSLRYTLEDIVDFFGDLEERRGPTRKIYKQTWIDMCTFFTEESGESLVSRLAKYKAFLNELEDLVKDKHHDSFLMSRLRESLKVLLAEQDGRLAIRLGGMSVSSPSSSSSNSTSPNSPVSDRKPRNRRSYERARPSHLSAQTPTSPSSGSFVDIPPIAPDVPGSPITNSSTSQSLGSSSLSDHWAKQVFFAERTRTVLRNVGECSRCFGKAHPGLRIWLQDEGFEELLQLAFPDGPDFRVYFFFREEDNRARIDSCLQLCRRHGDDLYLWANLKFSTMEEMVFFFCTFLALRSQDSGRPVERISDYELAGEKEVFGAPIIDDDYMHALRVFIDRATRAVRLQASVHEGEMDRAPVWTAFVTHQIKTRGWIHKIDPKTVALRDLHQAIFTWPEYTPPQTRNGDHVLKFRKSNDAIAFVEIMAGLARKL